MGAAAAAALLAAVAAAVATAEVREEAVAGGPGLAAREVGPVDEDRPWHWVMQHWYERAWLVGRARRARAARERAVEVAAVAVAIGGRAVAVSREAEERERERELVKERERKQAEEREQAEAEARATVAAAWVRRPDGRLHRVRVGGTEQLRDGNVAILGSTRPRAREGEASGERRGAGKHCLIALTGPPYTTWPPAPPS